MDFETMFLSPLGKEYCYLYYILMVFSLVQVVIGSIYALKHIVDSGKKNIGKTIFASTLGISTIIVEYILARLMYSICVKAL